MSEVFHKHGANLQMMGVVRDHLIKNFNNNNRDKMEKIADLMLKVMLARTIKCEFRAWQRTIVNNRIAQYQSDDAANNSENHDQVSTSDILNVFLRLFVLSNNESSDKFWNEHLIPRVQVSL